MKYLWRSLVWLDYFANQNVLRGHWESLSSRTYRNHKKIRFCAWLMVGLDSIQKDHCLKMYVKDRAANPAIPKVPWEI